jgi:multidrug efflux pump subunit AcrA (membrane-fusion protein)
MSPKNSFFRTSLAVFLISALLLAGCSTSTSKSGSSLGVVSTVTVTDKVETSGNLSADKLATLKWGTGGVVEKVNVQVGDKVKLNDVLSSLRLDSVDADIATGQSELATAQRDLQDMLDSTTSLAKAQLAVITARAEVETAQNNLDALDYARASDVYIKNLEAQILAAEKTLTLATRRYKEVQHHTDGDAQKTQAVLAMTSAQMDLNSLKATLNWLTAKATQADYDEAKANLEVARAALEDAKRTRDNVKDGADPLKVAAARGKVTAAQATVNTMYIIAPFDGEVISVQAGVGNSVKSADSAVELVDRQTLKVETLVDETTISSVSVGDPAAISMDSLPGEVLSGKVSRINRIGSTVNGLVKYTVIVAVDPTEKPVLFGATVNVTITTGEPQAMLAVPVGAVQTDTQGEYVTLVKAGGGTQRVAVTSGDLVETLVTITLAAPGELKAGDQLQLGVGSTSSSSSSSSNKNSDPGGGIPIPGAGGPPGG